MLPTKINQIYNPLVVNIRWFPDNLITTIYISFRFFVVSLQKINSTLAIQDKYCDYSVCVIVSDDKSHLNIHDQLKLPWGRKEYISLSTNNKRNGNKDKQFY